MHNIEEIRAMSPEEKAELQAKLGRKLLTRVLVPKLVIAAAIVAGVYIRNRTYQASVTEH